MRPNHNQKRSRGRNSGRRSGPNRHQSFDSNGPSVRIRGTAHQVHEKYLALARDAASSGDRVMAENLLQHADHYYRVLSEASEGNREQRQPNGQDRQAGRSRGNGAQREGSVNGSDEAEVPAATAETAAAEEAPDGSQEEPAGEATVEKPGAELAEAALASSGDDGGEETDTKPTE